MRKYLAIFKINLLNSLAYPAEIIARAGLILMFMWVFYQLWRVVYASGNTVEINGLSLNDTIWYLLLAETLELGKPRLSRTLAEQVRDGSIAYIINKPYNFILYQLFNGLGESLPRLGMLFLIGGALVWGMAGGPPPIQNFPVMIAALVGAWLLHFCASALIGLSAFIAEDVAAFEWIYQKLVFILGGFLVPLDFYPQWLQRIARALPFAYTTYGPARLFVEPSLQLFIQIMTGQLVWLAVFTGVLVLVYSRGMRRLAINGG